MNSEQIAEQLQRKGLNPTANRIIVMKALLQTGRPLSLAELFSIIETMDKSSIFRALSLFLDHDAVHTIDDGSGSLKYEPCTEEEHSVDDMHAHFHCEVCGRTYCLRDVEVHSPVLPAGFVVRSVNYVVKGTCCECGRELMAGDDATD